MITTPQLHTALQEVGIELKKKLLEDLPTEKRADAVKLIDNGLTVAASFFTNVASIADSLKQIADHTHPDCGK